MSLPSTATVKMRGTTTLYPTLYPSNATTTYTWESNDRNVATVSSSGVVTGVSEGEAVIKVTTANGYSAQCKVTCWKPVPTSVSISKSEALVALNATEQLSYSVLPTDAIYTAKWASSDTTVATVSQSGLVQPKKVGKTVISITTDNGKSAQCKVEVWKPVPTSITISESALRLQAYRKHTLTYEVLPTNAMYTAKWSSDDETIAAVTQDGVVEAKREGTTHIRITADNGKEAVCKVTVPPQPKSVELSKSNVELELPRSVQLTYALSPKAALADVEWTTSDAHVATITQGGFITARHPGTATITLRTDNGKMATCKVTVPKPAYHLFVWDKRGLKNGYLATDKPHVWLTAQNKLAVWTKSGGTIMMDTASVSHFTLERILPEDPRGLYLEPDYLLALGQTGKVGMLLSPPNATTTVQWFSSDEDVVSVAADGTLTAVGEGTAVITAQTHNGLQKSSTVKVPHPQPTFYVYNKDGSSLGYRLTERPNVQIGERIFTLRTDNTVVEYVANDVWKFTIEDGAVRDELTEVPAIETQPTLPLRLEDGVFTLDGYPQGSQVRIFDGNGRLVRTYRVADDGSLRFSVADLPAGIYVVKTESITYKIVKQ